MFPTTEYAWKSIPHFRGSFSPGYTTTQSLLSSSSCLFVASLSDNKSSCTETWVSDSGEEKDLTPLRAGPALTDHPTDKAFSPHMQSPELCLLMALPDGDSCLLQGFTIVPLFGKCKDDHKSMVGPRDRERRAALLVYWEWRVKASSSRRQNESFEFLKHPLGIEMQTLIAEEEGKSQQNPEGREGFGTLLYI